MSTFMTEFHAPHRAALCPRDNNTTTSLDYLTEHDSFDDFIVSIIFQQKTLGNRREDRAGGPCNYNQVSTYAFSFTPMVIEQ